MDSSKMSSIILDSDDDEMDDIIAEFAEEEGKEQVIQLSESEDEIDNLIEEFAAEIDDVDMEIEATSEACSVAAANDAITGDRDCLVICDKNNVSGKKSSFKNTKESCDSIKHSSRNEKFSSSSETDLSKTTSDNYAAENENCSDKMNNPPIIILKCESLSSASMSDSCSELSPFTNQPFNNVSRQCIPNKRTDENFLEEFKCDTTKNSVFDVCDKEVHKNCSTENNGILDVTNDTAGNREYIGICDKDNKYKNTYAISTVEILEVNSPLTEPSDSVDVSDVNASSLTINAMSKSSHNTASNKNTYAISSVEILEVNSPLTEPSDCIDVSDVDTSSSAINDVAKSSHNMVSNKDTYAISSVEILEENSSLTETSNIIAISDVDVSSLTLNDMLKPSHNTTSNKNTYAISSVEILEENSSLSEPSASIGISDVDASSLTINNMLKPSHNMSSNNISVTDVPESKSFCSIDTQKSISNRVAEIIITPEKLNSEENTATKSSQNLVDEGAILLENATCANNEYNRTDDVMILSERECHSKCIENLQSNDTKLIAQEPNGVVNKDSSVAISKLNCLKTVTEECVVNTDNKANSNATEDAFVQNSDVNYSASQIITSPVLYESPDVSSDVKIIDNSNSINKKLKISSNIKDTEKNLISCTSEEIYSEESFVKHREKLIVEIQSFISTAYDSSLKKDNINSIYERKVMDNSELSENVGERTSNSERNSISSDERDLSKMTQEGRHENQVRTNEITAEGSSDVNVLHQQESSITNESIHASAFEILKSDMTKNSEINVIDSKEVCENSISERNKRILGISENEINCKRLKNDVSSVIDTGESIQISAPEILKSDMTKNSEINVIDSKELSEKSISERNKRILEISENEFSYKRLKCDVSSVIDSNEVSLDLPKDFSSMKHTNKEEVVCEVIDLDVKPVDKINQQIPWNPHWKIEATKKTLDRIALNVSEEFVKKYYEKEYSQMKEDIRKLKELVKNFTDVTRNLLKVAMEFRSSQKVSFAESNFQKVFYRTVGTNVKIRKKESDEQRILNERKAAEKTLGMISDQKQDDVSPIKILNVFGNAANQKQENISAVISIPKASEIISDKKQQDVSPIKILNVFGNISDQKQQDVFPTIKILNVFGNAANQKQENISPVISIPKASEIVSDQKQEDVSSILTIPTASGIVSDQKQDVSSVLAIPTSSGIISDQKQDVSSILSISKASEIISDQKKQEIPGGVINIPKASGIISDQKKQGVSPVLVTIPKALKIISDQKQQNVSPVITIPKTSVIISSKKQENLSHIKTIPNASGIVSDQKQENISTISISKASEIVSDQNQENVPHIKAIPKVSVIDLPKNSSSSCINLSSSHGGASMITSFIPPLPYVMEGNRLVPYIEPSKPLPFSKPFVMPQTTAVTTVTNSQLAALLRKEHEQKGSVPNGVSHPLNNIAKLFQNVHPYSVPQRATLPLQFNTIRNITNQLTHQNIRRMVSPSQPRHLQFLQTNPTGANVQFISAANSITQASAISHRPQDPSLGILNYHPLKDSQRPLYYQVPRYNPPMPAHQRSHVPSQSLSVTMNHSSKVMPRLPNLAHCHPTYVHKTASPVISRSLPLHYNSASVNQHHPMSYQPLSVAAHNNPFQQKQPPASSNSLNSMPIPYLPSGHPLQMNQPPASSSSLNSMPIPYLPSGHNTNDEGRNVLPIPIVKGSVKDNGSVVISWDLPSLEQQPSIAFYQIYSCQVKHHEGPPVWKSVGDVASLDLPMACTLNHFEENNYYYFAVRVVDKLKNYGPFSNPVTIYYSEKSPKITGK